MFGLIAAGIAGAAGIFSHVKARGFVARRLRYTSIVERPLLGVWAGVGAVVVAAPVVAVLPIVGAGTALALGAGVGTGVALGVQDTRGPTKFLED